MRIKFLCLTCITLIGLLTAIAFAKDFPDVSKSHWAYETIMEMKNQNYLKGYPDGTFKPDKEVTREEFLQMLFNISATDSKDIKITDYIDVKSDRWSYEPIQNFGTSIKEEINGSTYFYPTKPIQRQEVAQVLSDYFDIDVSDDDIPSEKLEEKYQVKDVSFIDEKYESAVYNMYASGLMQGMGDNSFSPTTSLTRAQSSALLSRIIDKLAKPEEPEEPKKTEGTGELDFSFLKLENVKKNLIYSPLSIKYAMKMLAEGAKENTKTQIDNLVEKYNLTKYKSSDNLSLANSIFIRDSYKNEVLDSYITTLKDKYDAGIIYDAFKSANNINNWIDQKTFHLINNVLEDDQVTPADRILFLINALAIDMKWDREFSEENTRGQDFYKADNSKIQATTMKQTVIASSEPSDSAFTYYYDDEIQAIAKDLKSYDDYQLEFMAVMPKNQKLAEYVESMSTEEIGKIRKKISSNKMPASTGNVITRINLYIPKFKYEYELKFLKDLQALGMTDAFDPERANFFNMFKKPVVTGENYYVSEAIHKAMIEFSEEGIKAAAVTIFGMAKSTSISITHYEDIDIRFDHPFLFIIRDKKTGELWFVGTVYEPNLWEKDKSEYEMKW